MMQLVSLAQERFAQLQKREQLALVVMGIFFASLAFYFVLVKPIDEFRTSSSAAHERQIELYGYMKSSEAEARRAASTGSDQAGTGQSLLTDVSRIAQQLGMKPNRLQPEGTDAVSVWFDGVAFNELVRMLERLQSERGIVVQQISIDRDELPGVVRARIVLRS